MNGIGLQDYSDKNVLVVDDNKVNIKVMSMNLKQLGIEADTAFSGEEAVDRVKEKEYDMVIMDIVMPGMSGTEATISIRNMDAEYCKKVPIIAWTVNNLDGSEDDYFDAGMDDLLQKPVQLDYLKDMLSKYFE